MAIRQTRIFVHHMEPLDCWAETLIGRVIQPLVAEFREPLRWFWFSRYGCLFGMDGEDRDDCDFDAIPPNFKQAFPGVDKPGHRSLRFRFEIEDGQQESFEERFRQLVAHYDYAVSDVRPYNEVSDTGSDRHLGVENRRPGRNKRRARLVTQLYQAISQLVMDALVGPDPDNRFRLEQNDVLGENPNGSSFESLHHVFCNITAVPVSILLSAEDQPRLVGTFWGGPWRQGQTVLNGQPMTEVYLLY